MSSRFQTVPLIIICCLVPALITTTIHSSCVNAAYMFTNIVDSTMMASNGQKWDVGIWDNAVNGSNVLVQRNRGGVYVWSSGSLTKIVELNDPAPTGTFFDFGRTSTLATDNDSAAFIGVYGGLGIFTGSGGTLNPIVKVGDAAPSGQFTSFRLQNYMTGGGVPFYGEFTGGAGIYSGSGGPLTTMVKTGDPAPSGVFSQIHRFGLLGDSIAFTAVDAAGPGLFLKSGAGLTTIARIGGPAPVGVFAALAPEARSIAVSGDNVAFYGHYGQFPADGAGIFVGDGGPLTTIVRTGDPAPSGVFNNLDASALAIVGNTVVLNARYTNGSGVFISNGGPLTTVIKTGDPLFGQVVQSTFQISLDPGGSGSIAFNYFLANGVFGTALATPIPEPCCSSMLGITAVWIVRVTRAKASHVSRHHRAG